MGFELQTLLSKAAISENAKTNIYDASSCYLLDLYNKINELPTRPDIKGLLQKCVYSILIDEDVEEEIQFLSEVKKLLNQIRETCNNGHLEIICLIEEIYHLAVDKKLDENLKVNSGIHIQHELLGLFEGDNVIMDESELGNEEAESARSEYTIYYQNEMNADEVNEINLERGNEEQLLENMGCE